MSDREWTAADVDAQPGYGSENLAAYRCRNCGTVIPVTFVRQYDPPLPDPLSNYGCATAWNGCGDWGPMDHVETVRWVDDATPVTAGGETDA